MDPGAAQFHLVAGELAAEGAAAEPVSSLQQQGLVAVLHAVPRRGDAGEAAPDHHDVVVATGGLRLSLAVAGKLGCAGHGAGEHGGASRTHDTRVMQELAAADAGGCFLFVVIVHRGHSICLVVSA
ncbi:hypothetical protein D3C85_1562470 [compost metagenome]